jgi:AcrR family transcriptional regulator
LSRTKEIDDQTLLDGCRAAFLREGIGVSTRRLAQSVGVSEGVLFQRFHSKDELFLACMRLPAPDLCDALEEALTRKSLQAGLMVLGKAALGYLRRQMPVVLLVLAHPKHRDGSWATPSRSTTRSTRSWPRTWARARRRLATAPPSSGCSSRRSWPVRFTSSCASTIPPRTSAGSSR